MPFLAAMIGMVLIGRHSDRTGERKKHVAACAMVASIGLALAAAFQASVPLLVLSFALSQIGQRSLLGPSGPFPPSSWGEPRRPRASPSSTRSETWAARSGPAIMGWLRDVSHGYSGGLLVLAGGLILEAGIVLALRLPGTPPGTRARIAGDGAGDGRGPVIAG